MLILALKLAALHSAVLMSSSWFPFPPIVSILLFRRIFMTSHMTLSGTSFNDILEKLRFHSELGKENIKEIKPEKFVKLVQTPPKIYCVIE